MNALYLVELDKRHELEFVKLREMLLVQEETMTKKYVDVGKNVVSELT